MNTNLEVGKMKYLLSILICLMLIGSTAWCETVYVNGTTGNDGTGERGNPVKPFKTIQAGINASVNGDTVLVADGTYAGSDNKNLDFNGKAITVRSENGAGNCTIDCEGSGRGFYFHNGETSDAVVDGFTIKNGSVTSPGSDDGGGIYCFSSSPTIKNNIITGNSSPDEGGGISCQGSASPLIENNTITENSAFNGGGICCLSASPTIKNNTIMGNSAKWAGGIKLYNSFSTVVNNIITGNSATQGGGGFSCSDNTSPTIKNCTITGNSASWGGRTFFLSWGIYYDNKHDSLGK